MTDDELLACVDAAPWTTGKSPGHGELHRDHDPELWQAIVDRIARIGRIGYLDGEAHRFLILGDYQYWRKAELPAVDTLHRSRHSDHAGEISWADHRTGEKCIRVSSRQLADEELTAIIGSAPWRTAREQTDPHQYIFPDWPDAADIWQNVVDRITEHGRLGYFWGTPYRYLVFGDHYYWRMGEQPVNTILNRAVYVHGALESRWVREDDETLPA